jgi:hypothetical protein
MVRFAWLFESGCVIVVAAGGHVVWLRTPSAGRPRAHGVGSCRSVLAGLGVGSASACATATSAAAISAANRSSAASASATAIRACRLASAVATAAR